MYTQIHRAQKSWNAEALEEWTFMLTVNGWLVTLCHSLCSYTCSCCWRLLCCSVCAICLMQWGCYQMLGFVVVCQTSEQVDEWNVMFSGAWLTYGSCSTSCTTIMPRSLHENSLLMKPRARSLRRFYCLCFWILSFLIMLIVNSDCHSSQ